MSQPQDGRRMDQPSGMSGSVKRARERAQAGLPPGNSPPGLQTRDGQQISRPTQVPQWPLAGPVASSANGSEPYRPPPGRSQPPQRPPRPSKVPSILDGSRVQDPTPFFLSPQTPQNPQNPRISELSAPETLGTSSSRASTQSSVGSIPDFPLPVAVAASTPTGPPRRSVTLGPPPSARRGASSFYSTASFVSPIPEESPRSRSFASYASSMAMPESYGEISPAPSSNNGGYYDDTIAEESVYSDEADESRLVRSASVGKRGKPSLVLTRSAEKSEAQPVPRLARTESFQNGTDYVESSSDSSRKSAQGRAVLTADSMLNAIQAASATDPSSIRNATPSPRPFRLSAIRRPPRLDMDAVKDAEARGSLTSLPDLIRRATRLASMIDKGRRPTSQFNELDFPEAMFVRNPDRDTFDNEKYQSGLSDMLAAFPPPASNSRQSFRQSENSWPLPFVRRSFRGPGPPDETPDGGEQPRRKRRCCGLPIWAFIMLLIIILCIVAAAVILPVFFLVINRNDDNVSAQPVAEQCRDQLICANGGTTVITQGRCMCICSIGFIGPDCTVPSAQGCTTTSIRTNDSTINDATVGQAIPRLLENARANFSIPLSATAITAKFNSANLSCNTQNALVTFDGESLRLQNNLVDTVNVGFGGDLIQAAITTVLPDTDITITIDNPAITDGADLIVSTFTSVPKFTGSVSTILDTTLSPRSSDTESNYPTTKAPSPTTASSTIVPSSTTATPQPTDAFTVNDQVVDFARAAVLFIFQEETLGDAATAQTSLQRFFTSVNSGNNMSPGVTVENAGNLTIGGDNTIDLVELFLDLGGNRIGGGPSN